MKLPNPIEHIEALESPSMDEIADPTPQQGGAVNPESVHVQLDIFLNRLFQVGQLIPYKKCWMQVVGIRGGIVALALKSLPEVPRAQAGKGIRPPRRNQKPKRKKK
jgi:hypothetical protein